LLNITSDENYAKIAKYLEPTKFIYDVGIWYEFKNHRWIKKKGDNIAFKRDILKHIKNMLFQFIEHYKNDKRAVAYIKKQIKNIGDDIASKKIMNKITEEFCYSCSNLDDNAEEGEFYKKMDTDPYLLGLTNGVYDLKKNEFREGKMTDYISMTTGYKFINNHTDKINEIKQFFKDIQPDKEQREFLLTFLGSCLIGIQKDEIYTIFTGIKRNGKTTCMELLNLVLGDDYFGAIDTSFLTKARPESNAAQPELIELQKKRVVVTSENEAGDKLNTGHVKKITGGDPLKARQLYSECIIKFKPQFKLISLFNDIPDVDKLDLAFWSRCKVLHFPITFVDNPKEENEKLIDNELKNKLDGWKQDFLLMLIEYCQKYLNEGLKFPKGVEEQTNKYKESVDCYEQFFASNIEKDDDNVMSWTDLKTEFSFWYRENINDTVPNVKTIKKNFELKFKKNVSKCKSKDRITILGWKGMKIICDK
jgi:putative DNA primase/helicase